VPSCWRNIDHAGYGQVWRFDNPGGRVVNTSSAGNGFAILDSDYYGPGVSQDADLTTPVLDLTGYIGVRLEFEHYFLSYPGSVAILAFSLDSGTTWNPVQTWVTTTANAELFSQDVSVLVAGHPYVKFKWNFVGSDANYWAVDDINIFGTDVLPAADFSAGETIILAGGSVTYTDASTGNPDNWVWTFEGGDPPTFSGQSPPPVVYNTSGTYNTSLYVSNIWGNSTLTLTDLIQVGLPPEAGFFADDTVVAVGGVVNFTDMSGNEPDEWIWTFEGGEPASFVGQFPPAVGYLSPGAYNVTLYVSNLWGDNTLVQSDLILVGFPPEAGFAADVTTIFPGEAVVFTDQSLYEPLTWEWTFTGGIPENSILQDPGPVAYPVAGLFDVRLKVTNGFGMDILLKEGYIEVLPVGNTEIPGAGSIKVFPNPNDGSFTVTLSGDAPWQVSLINEIGQVVLKRVNMAGTSRVDLGANSRGIYLLRAMDDKGRVFSSKIICR
jgi:PKD repeat protein